MGAQHTPGPSIYADPKAPHQELTEGQRKILDALNALPAFSPGRWVQHAGRCYAIPTVQHGIAGPLTLGEIAQAVERFIAHAQREPETSFFVTRIGCGLAGHRDADIAPMFASAPLNCSLPQPWATYIERDSK